MIELAAEHFGLEPDWLVAEQKIEPHVSVIGKSSHQDGTGSRAEFIYDTETDTYKFPEGKTLTTSRRIVNEGPSGLYLGSTCDCDPRPLKQKFCPNSPAAGSRAASTRASPYRPVLLAYPPALWDVSLRIVEDLRRQGSRPNGPYLLDVTKSLQAHKGDRPSAGRHACL
jgi:hypothetical protein